jgi:hypothetical protein
VLATALLAATLVTGWATPQVPPKDGLALLRAMHDRYAATWYRTMTFVQATTDEHGKVTTWYEGLSVPGFLRIDIAPLDSAKAYIFRADSLYVIDGGKPTRAEPFVHPLMVLGFDVYRESVGTTAAKLTRLGFDLSKIREDTWQGRPVYVVGAAAGDTASAQFWVDRERLVFVRLIQQQRGTLAETQFNEYRRAGGGWVAAEVRFLSDGHQRGAESYSDIETGMTFPADFFDPAHFTRPAWVKGGE